MPKAYTPKPIHSYLPTVGMVEVKLSFSVQETAVPGTFMVSATYPHYPMPVGMVWFRMIGNYRIVEIIGSYVPEGLRRQGIRTQIHEFMKGNLYRVSAFHTDAATEDSEQWLKNQGFKQTEEGWKLRMTYPVKTKKKKTPKPKPKPKPKTARRKTP